MLATRRFFAAGLVPYGHDIYVLVRSERGPFILIAPWHSYRMFFAWLRYGSRALRCPAHGLTRHLSLSL